VGESTPGENNIRFSPVHSGQCVYIPASLR
jgi:hypothetical protein